MPPKYVDYADFLAQFELLWRDTLKFSLLFEKCDFLNPKMPEDGQIDPPPVVFQKMYLLKRG